MGGEQHAEQADLAVVPHCAAGTRAGVPVVDSPALKRMNGIPTAVATDSKERAAPTAGMAEFN